MPVSVVEANKQWGPCHKRVPAVVIECVEAAILAAFLRHLRAGLLQWSQIILTDLPSGFSLSLITARQVSTTGSENVDRDGAVGEPHAAQERRLRIFSADNQSNTASDRTSLVEVLSELRNLFGRLFACLVHG